MKTELKFYCITQINLFHSEGKQRPVHRSCYCEDDTNLYDIASDNSCGNIIFKAEKKKNRKLCGEELLFDLLSAIEKDIQITDSEVIRTRREEGGCFRKWLLRSS